jgi:hypothetical protein
LQRFPRIWLSFGLDATLGGGALQNVLSAESGTGTAEEISAAIRGACLDIAPRFVFSADM